jgi:hypothetical protein
VTPFALTLPARLCGVCAQPASDACTPASSLSSSLVSPPAGLTPCIARVSWQVWHCTCQLSASSGRQSLLGYAGAQAPRRHTDRSTPFLRHRLPACPGQRGYYGNWQSESATAGAKTPGPLALPAPAERRPDGRTAGGDAPAPRPASTRPHSDTAGPTLGSRRHRGCRDPGPLPPGPLPGPLPP